LSTAPILSALQKSLSVAGIMEGDLGGGAGGLSFGNQWQVLMKNLQKILATSATVLTGDQMGAKFGVLPGRDLAKCSQGTQLLESFMVEFITLGHGDIPWASTRRLVHAAVGLQEGPQLLEAPVVVVPYVGQGFFHLDGNLFHEQPLKVGQVQCAAFPFRQRLQPLFNHLTPILIGEAIPSPHRVGKLIVFQVRFFRLVIEVSQGQVFLPVETSVIGILQNPGLGAPLVRIKDFNPPVNLNEYLLHEIFRFAPITKDFERHAEDQAIVAVKKKAQSFLATLLELFHQFFVGPGVKV
jgi:hypothetical protein